MIGGQSIAGPPPPMGLLAELTHRCPLRCPYCSNPLELEAGSNELSTSAWLDVLSQAASLGVLQVHFSGGEPMVRKDLPRLVEHAAREGLYSNLITSGIMLGEQALASLVAAGLDHIQLSFQDVDERNADRIGGLPGGHARKIEVAHRIRDSGIAFTINFVVHRQNIVRIPEMILLGERLGASRVEIAHTQYYGWGLLNRETLIPNRESLDLATAQVQEASLRLRGRMNIDYVAADYHASRPKACMGGWAQRFMNISPAGKVLPCHAAEMLPGLSFPSVRDHTLVEIWRHDASFLRFRGTAWMPEPCRSCDQKEVDWGGCRCQAFLLAGDAAKTDPACSYSPDHGVMQAAVGRAGRGGADFHYRGARSDMPAGDR